MKIVHLIVHFSFIMHIKLPFLCLEYAQNYEAMLEYGKKYWWELVESNDLAWNHKHLLQANCKDIKKLLATSNSNFMYECSIKLDGFHCFVLVLLVY